MHYTVSTQLFLQLFIFDNTVSASPRYDIPRPFMDDIQYCPYYRGDGQKRHGRIEPAGHRINNHSIGDKDK